MGLSGMSHCVENERKVPGKKKTFRKVKMGLSGMSHCVENERKIARGRKLNKEKIREK